MPRFGQMLKSLIDSSGMSISKLAQATGIDRPTIHKYIAGRRMPTEDKFICLLTALKATANEQIQLREQYELENLGEFVYYQRMAVKQLIANLKLIDQHNLSFKLPYICMGTYIASEKLQVIEGCLSVKEAIIALASEAKGKLCLFAGFPTDLLQLIVTAVLQRADPSTQIQQLLCYPKQLLSQEDVRQCITILADVIPLSFNTDIRYQAYYYYENTIYCVGVSSAFPYGAIWGDAVVMISADCEHLAIIRDRNFTEIYREHFEHLLKISKPLATKIESNKDQIDAFSVMEESAERNYIIQTQPLLLRYACKDLVQNVLSDIQVKNYAWYNKFCDRIQRMRSKNDDMVFFNESGIELFAREGYIAELKKSTEVIISPADRIKILKGLRKDCMINYRRMLRPDLFRMPSNMIIEIQENCGAAFIVANEYSHQIIIFREDGIVRALSSFAEYLINSDNVATKEETVAMLDKYIDQIEHL